MILIYVLLIQLINTALTLKKYADLPDQYRTGHVDIGLVDSSGRLWLALRGMGLLSYSKGRWSETNSTNGLISNGITSAVQKRNGLLCFAGIEGINILDGSDWQHISFEQIGLLGSRPLIFSITENFAGNLIIGANGGVAIQQNDEWRHYTADNGLHDNIVHDVQLDKKGNLWAATRKSGINALIDGKWQYFFNDRNARKILISPDNHIWVAAAPGVLEYDQSVWKRHKSDINYSLFPIFVDSRQRIWFYEEENKAISLYENSNWVSLTLEIPVDMVFQSDQNQIFIVSGGSVYQLNNF
ncbi:MAG: hypothetical protein KDD94_14980 [Calditrichaeota bacterium]|nr:hypothetical protein [Calditrichota bacterium]